MGLRGIPLFFIFYQLCLSSAQKLVLRTSPPSPVHAGVNTDLVLTCSVDDSNLIALKWASYTNNNVNSTTSNRGLTNVVFHRLNYSDDGVYYCQAFNQTSGLVVAQTNITVKVGDPPPQPPTPTMKRVCGYPPTEVIISYQYTTPLLTPTHVHYPVTVELIVIPISTINPCMRVSDNFKVVEKSRQIIHRPKNYSFEVNVADIVMEMVPDFPFCCKNDNLSFCSFLCTSVCTKNVFGTICSETTVKKIKAYSGEVADFGSIKVGRNSISVAWGLPRCLRNRVQMHQNLYYWIWCERSSCGSKIMITSNVNAISGLNYTIYSLIEHTNYTIYASSSFFPHFSETSEHVSISVQTKEGVPREAPVINTIRWLSECTESNGTALVSWKANDKAALLGEVRQYVLTYQEANSSSRTIRNVSASVQQLVISGLRMDKSYELTIRVCTGGGCSKASSYYRLLSFDCTSSDAPPDRSKVFDPKWIWIPIGVIFISVLLASITVGYAVFKQRRKGRANLRPALPDGICPTAEFTLYQAEPDSDYARADGRFSSRSDPAFLANELRISSTCLSRSSSVLTCSTEIQTTFQL